MVAVPWSLLQQSETASAESQESSQGSFGQANRPTFTVNTTLSKLQQAPSLTRGSWSEISQPQWQQQVYSFFGVTAPSQSSMGGGTSPTGTTSGFGTSTNNEEGTSTNSSTSSSTSGQ